MKFCSRHMSNDTARIMSDEIKNTGTATEHGSFEHQDLRPAAILYFLVTLRRGDRDLHVRAPRPLCLSRPPRKSFAACGESAGHQRSRGHAPRRSRISAERVFPSPKLEEDERGQFNGIRMAEEKTLYSYGWVDEKAGTVRIPIERAMDLLVQRGLPVRPQGAERRRQHREPRTQPRRRPPRPEPALRVKRSEL